MTVAVGWIDGGRVDGGFAESVTKLASYEQSRGRLSDILRVKSGPQMCEGRNTLVERFLDTPAEWLMSVDTDMIFQYNSVERLLATAEAEDVKMVGGLCYGVNQEFGQFPTLYRNLNGFPVVILDPPDTGTFYVDATGAAFTLTHRTIFEDYERDHPHKWFHRQEVVATDSRPGGVLGEDISWCWWLRINDVPIVVDLDVQVGHIKPATVAAHTYRTATHATD